MVSLFLYNLGEIPGFCLFQEPLEEPWQDQPFLASHRALLNIRRFFGKYPANRWWFALPWTLWSVWKRKLSRAFGPLSRAVQKSVGSCWELFMAPVPSR